MTAKEDKGEKNENFFKNTGKVIVEKTSQTSDYM